jgi:hypothetical protein
MPLERWADAATSPRLPRRVRIRLAQVAFTRAVVLGRSDMMLRLAPILAALAPTLRADLTQVIQAPDDQARHRAGVLLLLRTPGMTVTTSGLESEYPEIPIEPYRANVPFAGYWWCGAEFTPHSDLTAFLFDNAFPAPQFLSGAERAAADRDVVRLNQHGASEMYLTTEALSWSRASPDDPAVPEALSRAVRGWRYVHCGVGRDSSLARQAFRLLHTRYAGSEWAQRTPYWYE